MALTPPEIVQTQLYRSIASFFPLVVDQLKAGEGIRRQIRFYLGEKRESTMIETPFATTFDNYEGILGITQLMSYRFVKILSINRQLWLGNFTINIGCQTDVITSCY